MIKLKKKLNDDYEQAKFHHLGIACNNIEETFSKIKIFLPNYIYYSNIIFDKKINAKLQLVKLNNSYFIELISGELVKNIIKKDILAYHSCFEVKNFNSFTTKLIERRFMPITKATPADLFNGRLVQFFRTPMGLVEILEKK
jgi:hypothetical protein